MRAMKLSILWVGKVKMSLEWRVGWWLTCATREEERAGKEEQRYVLRHVEEGGRREWEGLGRGGKWE